MNCSQFCIHFEHHQFKRFLQNQIQLCLFSALKEQQKRKVALRYQKKGDEDEAYENSQWKIKMFISKYTQAHVEILLYDIKKNVSSCAIRGKENICPKLNIQNKHFQGEKKPKTLQSQNTAVQYYITFSPFQSTLPLLTPWSCKEQHKAQYQVPQKETVYRNQFYKQATFCISEILVRSNYMKILLIVRTKQVNAF